MRYKTICPISHITITQHGPQIPPLFQHNLKSQFHLTVTSTHKHSRSCTHAHTHTHTHPLNNPCVLQPSVGLICECSCVYGYSCFFLFCLSETHQSQRPALPFPLYSPPSPRPFAYSTPFHCYKPLPAYVSIDTHDVTLDPNFYTHKYTR